MKTRLGLDVDAFLVVQCGPDPAGRKWAAQVLPAFSFAVKVQALTEALNCWRVTVIDRLGTYRAHPPRDELETYDKIVYTPPARPEWLVVL